MPQTMNNMMIALTLSVATIMILRYIATWYRFRIFLDHGDEDTLRRLISELNLWIVRHGVCVTAALAMVAAIRFLADDGDYERLVASITTYAIMSFMFAFVESVMAQWLEGRMVAIRSPEQQLLDSEQG